jgi:hypothetical protein
MKQHKTKLVNVLKIKDENAKLRAIVGRYCDPTLVPHTDPKWREYRGIISKCVTSEFLRSQGRVL